MSKLDKTHKDYIADEWYSKVTVNGHVATTTFAVSCHQSFVNSQFAQRANLQPASGLDDAVVDVLVSSPACWFTCPVTLHTCSDGSFDLSLGLDWFLMLLAEVKNPGQCPGKIDREPRNDGAIITSFNIKYIDTTYENLCNPMSRQYIYSLSGWPLDIVLAEHILPSPGQIPFPSLDEKRKALCQHLLNGHCAAYVGPACRGFTDECDLASTRPWFISMTLLHFAGSSTSFPLESLRASCASIGITGTKNHERKSLLRQLQERMDMVNYMPFTRDPIVLTVFEGYERIPKPALKKLAEAHGLDSSQSAEALRNVIMSHITKEHCVHDTGGANPSRGCLDIVLEHKRTQQPKHLYSDSESDSESDDNCSDIHDDASGQ